MASDAGTRVRCADCDAALDEPSSVPAEERTPCPACGSTRRTVIAPPIKAQIRMSATARGTVIRAWDGVSLTLFGVLYGIVVTVAGVVVAMVGTDGSWLWWAVYAVASLGFLALGLLVFHQPVIAAMRWLVGRATQAPR